jgi:hypothetical protein
MIVNRYERVYVEDLNVQGMMRNRRLSKSLGDAGWGMLRNALTYMARARVNLRSASLFHHLAGVSARGYLGRGCDF